MPGIGGPSIHPPTEYLIELAQGRIVGRRFLRKFGRNPDIDGAFEDIWNGGSVYTGFNATGAETVEIFSSDAADTAAGTGAQQVQILEGLDENFNIVPSEIVTLNGITPVNTTNAYRRLPRMRVVAVGSGGSNAGTITARQNVTTANVFAVMPIGYNTTMIGAYTVPNGEKGTLVSAFAGFAGSVNADSNVRLSTIEEGQPRTVLSELSLRAAGTSFVQLIQPAGVLILPAKTDIVVSADTTSPNTAISCEFSLVLETV